MTAGHSPSWRVRLLHTSREWAHEFVTHHEPNTTGKGS